MYVILVETTIHILPQARHTYVKAIYELNPCTMHVRGSIYVVTITEITNNIAMYMFLKEQN